MTKRRNARVPPRKRRNANILQPMRRTTAKMAVPEIKEPPRWHAIAKTTLGTLTTSLVGAVGASAGVPPLAMSLASAVGGGALVATGDPHSKYYDVYVGVTQAGLSQFIADLVRAPASHHAPATSAPANQNAPATSAPANQNAPAATATPPISSPPATSAPHPAAAPPAPIRIRQAAFGGFSPGELEAAFQRAQAEVAIAHDSHSHGHDAHLNVHDHELVYGFAA